jgi:transcriptional regulator with XRE-family HTH domain
LVKIKKLRELRNLTQEHVAHKLGITQGSYSKIELGKVDVPMSKLEEIAHVLNIPLDEMIGFRENLVFNMKYNKKANGLVINQVSATEKRLYEDFIQSLKAENSYLKETINKLLGKKQTNKK